MEDDINIIEKKEKFLKFLNSEDYTPMKVKELEMILQVPREDKEIFKDVINSLVKDGKAFITKKGKITTPERAQIIVGTFWGTTRSFGFVSPDDPNSEEIFIPPSAVNGATHKDKVFCRIVTKESGAKKSEGEVVEIIEKAFSIIVGTFVEGKKHGFVIPDNKKLSDDIFIKKGDSKGAVTGSKVSVRLKKNNGDYSSPEGRIVEILGHKNDPGVDILSIISQFEIKTEFPEDVYEETENIPTSVDESEIGNRKDLREKIIVTIDGDDTKDVDDAISLELLENGNYKLGVYIADVAHYVKHNSPLDVEALSRGTSVYLVDRVIPMLPHKLSNGICSLDENVDRLCLGCEIELDVEGNVIGHEIIEGIIHVNKKMTYNKVFDVLTNEDSEHLEEYGEYLDMLKKMSELSGKIREKRIERGAIEFDFPEAKIIVDEFGHPTDITTRERNIATNLIEEFMLITNETIAEQFFWLEMPFVYRTHEEPDEEKMGRLVEFIRNFGHKIKSNAHHPKNLQNLLLKVQGTPEENIISRVMLRSLKQARYTDTNYGHFGLAASYYCHFTSPIRRYPDLQIHRIIKEYINLQLDEHKKNYYNSFLTAVAKQCSKTERVAEEAEREVDKLKKVEFMEDKIDQVFEGIISSVTTWGIYVTLPNTIEGMVFAETLPDDTYSFDESLMRYVGKKKGRAFSLGDRVKVRLISCNVDERKIDFVIYEDDETEE